MPVVDLANDKPPGLIKRAGRDLDQGGIFPESLSGLEVDAVLLLVGLTLEWIELKLHKVLILYLFADVQRAFWGDPCRLGIRQELLNPALVQGAGDQPRPGGWGRRNLEGGTKTLGEGGLRPNHYHRCDRGTTARICAKTTRRKGRNWSFIPPGMAMPSAPT